MPSTAWLGPPYRRAIEGMTCRTRSEQGRAGRGCGHAIISLAGHETRRCTRRQRQLMFANPGDQMDQGENVRITKAALPSLELLPDSGDHPGRQASGRQGRRMAQRVFYRPAQVISQNRRSQGKTEHAFCSAAPIAPAACRPPTPRAATCWVGRDRDNFKLPCRPASSSSKR